MTRNIGFKGFVTDWGTTGASLSQNQLNCKVLVGLGNRLVEVFAQILLSYIASKVMHL